MVQIQTRDARGHEPATPHPPHPASRRTTSLCPPERAASGPLRTASSLSLPYAFDSISIQALHSDDCHPVRFYYCEAMPYNSSCLPRGICTSIRTVASIRCRAFMAARLWTESSLRDALSPSIKQVFYLRYSHESDSN